MLTLPDSSPLNLTFMVECSKVPCYGIGPTMGANGLAGLCHQ